MNQGKAIQSEEDGATMEVVSSFDQVPAAMTLLLKKVGHLESIMDQRLKNERTPVQKAPITSVKGLAAFLNCSETTAQSLKNSGRIPFIQFGKKMIMDPDKVLEALGQAGNKEAKRVGKYIKKSSW